jgi:purine-binding chemotaxis protein CheW
VNRLATLRVEFDRSFAEPLRRSDTEHDELLAIRAGGRPYVIRLAQTAGLYPDRPVTPLPGPLPALLGLAGFGGAIVPVYDLAALLGHAVPERPHWLVLAAGGPPLALAFHELDGHVRVPSSAIVAESHAGAGSVRGMVTLPAAGEGRRAGPAAAADTRPIVDLGAARTEVHRMNGQGRAT